MPPQDIPGRKSGAITMIDLAGNEGSIESFFHDKAQMAATAEINSSLSTLKECLRGRANGSAYVPYRCSTKQLLCTCQSAPAYLFCPACFICASCILVVSISSVTYSWHSSVVYCSLSLWWCSLLFSCLPAVVLLNWWWCSLLACCFPACLLFLLAC